MNKTRRFRPGDAVTVPGDYCPGCKARIPSMGAIITGHLKDGDQSPLFGDTPGPFYTVLIDHEHSGDGNLVYAEAELSPASP